MPVTIRKIDDFSGFDPDQTALFTLFDKLEVVHTTYEHPPIFTVEEGLVLDLPKHIPGQHGKSLFLTDKNDNFWLVVACEETRVDLKGLSDRLQTKRFSFAKPEQMVAILGVTPGSATPFALINDTQKTVRIIVEERYKEAEFCVFHPLRNTHSTVISVNDLLRFIHHLGYKPDIVPVA